MGEQGIAVRVTSFGQGRHVARLAPERATVAEALRQYGLDAGDRRVALNGHPAQPGAGVIEGDEVSVIPRVRGG